jgi:hypothetical protein
MFNKYWLNKHASAVTDMSVSQFLSAPLLLPPSLHPGHNSFLPNPLILNNIAICTSVTHFKQQVLGRTNRPHSFDAIWVA